MKLRLTLLVLVSLAALVASQTATAVTPAQADAIVTKFAGQPVRVRPGMNGGIASYQDGLILMLPSYYRTVLRMPRTNEWTAWTLYALAHETGHAARGASEAHANQWAMNHYKPFARAFGFSPKQTDTMFRQARRAFIEFGNQEV